MEEKKSSELGIALHYTENQLRKKESEIDLLVKSKERIQEQYINAKSRLEVSEQTQEINQSQHQKLKTKISQLKKDLEFQQQSTKQSEEFLMQAKKRLEAEQDSFRQKISEMERSYQERIQNILDSNRVEVESKYRTEMDNDKGDLQKWAAAYASLESSNQGLILKDDQLILDLNDRIERSKKEIAQLKSSKKDLEQMVQDLTKALKEQKLFIINTKEREQKRISGIETEKKKLEEDLDKSIESIDLLKKQIKESEEKILLKESEKIKFESKCKEFDQVTKFELELIHR